MSLPTVKMQPYLAELLFAMYYICMIAVLATAQAADQSCAEYCNFLISDQRTVVWRPDCTCSFEHLIKKHETGETNQVERVTVPDDSAIYYEPSGGYSNPGVTFADNPFYIVNPTYQKLSHNINEFQRNRNIESNINKAIRSTNKLSGIHNEISNSIKEIDIDTSDIPIYLDIDVHKISGNERSSRTGKNIVEKFQLSEENLIECIDLHILVFLRKADADNDLKELWNDKKIYKYNDLSDSELKIEIQSKCHHPTRLVNESLEEIANFSPKKASNGLKSNELSKEDSTLVINSEELIHKNNGNHSIKLKDFEAESFNVPVTETGKTTQSMMIKNTEVNQNFHSYERNSENLYISNNLSTDKEKNSIQAQFPLTTAIHSISTDKGTNRKNELPFADLDSLTDRMISAEHMSSSLLINNKSIPAIKPNKEKNTNSVENKFIDESSSTQKYFHVTPIMDIKKSNESESNTTEEALNSSTNPIDFTFVDNVIHETEIISLSTEYPPIPYTNLDIPFKISNNISFENFTTIVPLNTTMNELENELITKNQNAFNTSKNAYIQNNRSDSKFNKINLELYNDIKYSDFVTFEPSKTIDMNSTTLINPSHIASLPPSLATSTINTANEIGITETAFTQVNNIIPNNFSDESLKEIREREDLAHLDADVKSSLNFSNTLSLPSSSNTNILETAPITKRKSSENQSSPKYKEIEKNHSFEDFSTVKRSDNNNINIAKTTPNYSTIKSTPSAHRYLADDAINQEKVIDLTESDFTHYHANKERYADDLLPQYSHKSGKIATLYWEENQHHNKLNEETNEITTLASALTTKTIKSSTKTRDVKLSEFTTITEKNAIGQSAHFHKLINSNNGLLETSSTTLADHVKGNNGDNHRLAYPEKDMKIPKIITKEYKNDTVISQINGTEILPNADFIEANIFQTKVTSSSHYESSINDLKDSNASKIISIDTGASMNNSNISGRLYYLFGEQQIPARFVQDSTGILSVGIDGVTLCDKIMQKQERSSLIMNAICKCYQLNNCSKDTS